MEHDQVESHFFLGLLVGVLVLNFFVFLPYLDAIVLSATFAIVFGPVSEKITKLLRGNRGMGAVITMLLVLFLIFIPILVLSVKLFNEAANLYAYLSSPGAAMSLTHSVNVTVDQINQRFHVNLPVPQLDEYVRLGLGWTIQHLGAIFSGILSAIGFIALSLLGLYYFLKDGERFRAALEGLMPLSSDYTTAIFSKLHATVNSVVGGTLTIAVIQGILSGIGFAIFGVPSPIFWGAISVIGSLIPMVGSAFTIIPAALYLLVTRDIFSAIGIALWGLAIVGTSDNLMRPYLLKRSVNIHPFLILLSVLGGLGLFGPIGFLLGPLVLSLLFALFEIYSVAVLKKRNVPETA